MTLGELISVLKARDSSGDRPFINAADDITDVLAELADVSGSPPRECAGGLALRTVDIGNVIRIGLEEMIKAHRIVEAQRRPLLAGDDAHAHPGDAPGQPQE